MSKVRIMADTVCDLSEELKRRYEITTVPLYVTRDGVTYRDGIDITQHEVFEHYRTTGKLCSTAAINVEDFSRFFQEQVKTGEEIIFITISSEFSSTYQNACMIRDEVGSELCHVLDGRNATGGQRILVEYAAKLRDEGHTAAEIVEMVGGLRDRIVLYACMDTMEYLYRGGRISHTAYTLGSLAQIKPIIKVQGGRVEVPTKAMGMRKGMEFLCKRLDVYKPSAEFPFYVMYTDVRANGELLAERLGMEMGAALERILS